MFFWASVAMLRMLFSENCWICFAVASGYYYGFLQSITNLIVALVPICMVSFPALQLGLMCVVLWVRQTALCLLWPWMLGVPSVLVVTRSYYKQVPY